MAKFLFTMMPANDLGLPTRLVPLARALADRTPETDPLPATAAVTYVGPIVWQRGNATLPDWVAALSRDTPVIWVYSGNPRYGAAPTPLDPIVVIRAAIAA